MANCGRSKVAVEAPALGDGAGLGENREDPFVQVPSRIPAVETLDEAFLPRLSRAKCQAYDPAAIGPTWRKTVRGGNIWLGNGLWMCSGRLRRNWFEEERMWGQGDTEILVVDDDLFFRLDLSDRLTRRGFAVFRAANPDQAISIMEKHPSISAIFSDLQMPGYMDGLALLREIGRRWPGRHLVLISGLNSPSQQEMPPGTRFLSKPVTPISLDRTLQDFSESKVRPSAS